MLRSQEVKSLTEKSRQLKDLERSLHHCLPSMLADYCQIRSYQNSVLCLDAASGSAATQLRFIQHQLLPRLKKLNVFKDLERITIRVQASGQLPPRHSVRKAVPVSTENRQLIQAAADTVSDPALAESLRRLASTLNDYGKD